jgi:hypothetical protein
MDIRKELALLIIECLRKKPPQLVAIGDETLGGLVPDAEMVVETIMMKLESLYLILLGRACIKDQNRAEYDIRNEVAEGFLKDLGIIDDDIQILNQPSSPEPVTCEAECAGRK